MSDYLSESDRQSCQNLTGNRECQLAVFNHLTGFGQPENNKYLKNRPAQTTTRVKRSGAVFFLTPVVPFPNCGKAGSGIGQEPISFFVLFFARSCIENIFASSPVKRWVLAMLALLCVAPVPATPLLTGCGRYDHSSLQGRDEEQGLPVRTRNMVKEGERSGKATAKPPAVAGWRNPKKEAWRRGAWISGGA